MAAANPAETTTLIPEMAPIAPVPYVSGAEPGRLGVLRVDRREQRSDDPEHVRAARRRSGGPAPAWRCTRPRRPSTARRRRRRRRGRRGSSGRRWRRRRTPATAACSVSIAYWPARSLMTMSMIRRLRPVDVLAGHVDVAAVGHGGDGDLGDRHLLGRRARPSPPTARRPRVCCVTLGRDHVPDGQLPRAERADTSGRAASMKLTTWPTIGSGSRPRLSAVVWCAAARLKISSRSRRVAVAEPAAPHVECVLAGGPVLDVASGGCRGRSMHFAMLRDAPAGVVDDPAGLLERLHLLVELVMRSRARVIISSSSSSRSSPVSWRADRAGRR